MGWAKSRLIIKGGAPKKPTHSRLVLSHSLTTLNSNGFKKPLYRSSFEGDVTNSAFDLMDIQPRVCREKAVCEAEAMAKESYVFGNIMKLTR